MVFLFNLKLLEVLLDVDKLKGCRLLTKNALPRKLLREKVFWKVATGAPFPSRVEVMEGTITVSDWACPQSERHNRLVVEMFPSVQQRGLDWAFNWPMEPSTTDKQIKKLLNWTLTKLA